MNIDEIFDHIGGLGRQQWKYTVYLSLIHLYFPSQMLSYPFVARKLGLFHCTPRGGSNETTIGECPGNEVGNCASLAFPEQEEGGECHRISSPPPWLFCHRLLSAHLRGAQLL